MNETYLTAVGRLITTPERWRFADGSFKVSFRIASNQRRFDRTGNGWVDGDTLYMTVVCWRGLADNVHASFQVGDPIIVHGRLITREWEKDGKRRSIVELDASAVGPNLSGCTTAITRTKRAAPAAESEAAETEATAVAGESGNANGRTGSMSSAAAAATGAAPDGGDPWQGFGTTDATAEAGGSGDGFLDEGWPGEGPPAEHDVAVEAAVGS